MNRIAIGFALVTLCSLASSATAQERPPSTEPPVAAHDVPANVALTAPTDRGYLSSHPGQDLVDVHAAVTTATSAGADERTIAVVLTQSSAEPKIVRMLATPRLLRRMKAERTVAKLAEDFRACYVEDPAQKNAPSAIVRVEVEPGGAIDDARVESGASATPKITACLFSAAMSTKFAPPGGAGTAVLVQVRTR